MPWQCECCGGTGYHTVKYSLGGYHMKCPWCNGTGRNKPIKLPFTYWLQKNERG